MATIREYFEKDFSNAFRVHLRAPFLTHSIETAMLLDFDSFSRYIACYFPGDNYELAFFKAFITELHTKRTLIPDDRITLPLLKHFEGKVKFYNKPPVEITTLSPGAVIWKSGSELFYTGRIYLYSERDLKREEIKELYHYAKSLQFDLMFRSGPYAQERNLEEKPLGFISHDSRDKEAIAQPIARYLQTYRCPVWYDEFSLKIGDNLRTTIEKGIKECKKCILILSPHFLSNSGWTKTEFDSIFTRQILEGTSLILPIWHKITKEQIYEYCPSLLNIKGILWEPAKAEEISRELFRTLDG